MFLELAHNILLYMQISTDFSHFAKKISLHVVLASTTSKTDPNYELSLSNQIGAAQAEEILDWKVERFLRAWIPNLEDFKYNI